MLKKIIINIVIGGAIFIFGALLHELTEMEDVSQFIIVSGIAYGALSFGFILFKHGIPLFNKMVSERENTKAQDDLLKYKKLLDEGILNQD